MRKGKGEGWRKKEKKGGGGGRGKGEREGSEREGRGWGRGSNLQCCVDVCQAEIWDLTESGVARCSSGNAIQPP